MHSFRWTSVMVLLAANAFANSDTDSHPTNISVDDSNLLLAPYVWKRTGAGAEARAEAMMPGAYLKAEVRGTSTVSLLVDGAANVGCPTAGLPIVDFSVDGREFESVRLKDEGGVYALPLADHLDAGARHRVDVFFRSGTLGGRWESTRPDLRIAGLKLDTGGSLGQRETLRRNAILFGDSITEGVLTDGKGPYYADLTQNNARETWAPLVASALQCEYGQLGSGGQGMVMPMQLPPLPRTWDHYDPSTSRLTQGRLLPQPDYLFCLMGTNDFEALKPGILWKLVDITGEYTRWLENVRDACPDTAIFCITPPLGLHREEIAAAVKTRNKAGDKKVFLVDTTPLADKFIPIVMDWPSRTYTAKQVPTQFAGDGVHPTVYGNAVLGSYIAAEVARQYSPGSP